MDPIFIHCETNVENSTQHLSKSTSTVLMIHLCKAKPNNQENYFI